MSEQTPPPSPPAPEFVPYESSDSDGSKEWIPITALVLGCVNFLSWCIPLCGCPVGVAGIIFGVLGLKSKSKRGFAMAGLIMSIISMLLTIGNAVVGMWMQMNKKGIWGP
jgi:hypothetical protein